MDIEIRIGDITATPDVDAIVNAAKPSLGGGGGVDGAVHAAAGPGLLGECLSLPIVSFDGKAGEVRCPTGAAQVTGAYDLPNSFVVHTAGPVYDDWGAKDAPSALRACYINSIMAAQVVGAESIAFPSISTGIYGYPLEAATIVAVKSVMECAKDYPDLKVVFVCFDEANYLVYDRVLTAALSDWQYSVTI